MKRLLVLCSFALACGMGEQAKPEVEVKGSALDYAPNWIYTGYVVTSWDSHGYKPGISSNVYMPGALPKVQGQELTTNRVATYMGAQDHPSSYNGIVLTTSSLNATVNTALSQLEPSQSGMITTQGATCNMSNINVVSWTGATVTPTLAQFNCSSGSSQYRLRITGMIVDAYADCYAQTIQFYPTWDLYTQCLQNGVPTEWVCAMQQVCYTNGVPTMYTLYGLYSPTSGLCSPSYAYC